MILAVELLPYSVQFGCTIIKSLGCLNESIGKAELIWMVVQSFPGALAHLLNEKCVTFQPQPIAKKVLSHSHLIFWHLNWSMVIELMLINQGNFRSHHFAQLPWAKHGDRWAEKQGTHRWNKNKVEACGIKWGKFTCGINTWPQNNVKCWVLQLPFKINC